MTPRLSLPLPPLLPKAAAGVVMALLLGPAALAAPVVLAPQFAGRFATGTGSDAHFVRVDSRWHGSQVLWDEANRQFGHGDPIGSFSWGTGLWGRSDWQLAQAAADGQGGPLAPPVVDQRHGLADRINFGNSRYNECYSSTWGPAPLLPFFSAAPNLGRCVDAEAGDAAQQNWTAHFEGFIRIVDPGTYNFSVLYDDGFFLRLIGEGGQALEIEQDYLNSRDREGFGNDLQLSPGLYGFELGAWNRLGAGVVDLRWSRGDTNWTLVPTANLLPTTAVPEPSAFWLMVVALLILPTLPRARLLRSGGHLPDPMLARGARRP